MAVEVLHSQHLLRHQVLNMLFGLPAEAPDSQAALAEAEAAEMPDTMQVMVRAGEERVSSLLPAVLQGLL